MNTLELSLFLLVVQCIVDIEYIVLVSKTIAIVVGGTSKSKFQGSEHYFIHAGLKSMLLKSVQDYTCMC